jgi:methyl-accepting chemotaxis protein
LSVRISPRSDEDALSKNMALALETLRGVVDETGVLIGAARAGELGKRGNGARFQGAYRELVEGVNEMLEALVQPVTELSSVLAQVERGSLTARMTGSYRGEFARVEASLNLAVEQLGSALLEVRSATGEVGHATHEINEGAQGLAGASSDQASRLQEVSSALQEMAQAAQKNATSSQEAQSVSEATAVSTEKSTEAMQRLSAAATASSNRATRPRASSRRSTRSPSRRTCSR